MAVKAKRVKGDQNSQEFDVLRRNFNSLLVVLQNVMLELSAGTTTAAQAALAMSDALRTGVDIDNAPHVGTGRRVVGLSPSPLAPPRAKESDDVVAMTKDSKF